MVVYIHSGIVLLIMLVSVFLSVAIRENSIFYSLPSLPSLPSSLRSSLNAHIHKLLRSDPLGGIVSKLQIHFFFLFYIYFVLFLFLCFSFIPNQLYHYLIGSSSDRLSCFGWSSLSYLQSQQISRKISFSSFYFLF